MSNPVMVVHTQSEYGTDRKLGRVCLVWCPGCDMLHRINVLGEDGSRDSVIWDWDGNMERPTFDPSILVFRDNDKKRCHSYLKNGQWQFLTDSGHGLAGKTFGMVPLPDWACKPPRDEEEVTWP